MGPEGQSRGEREGERKGKKKNEIKKGGGSEKGRERRKWISSSEGKRALKYYLFLTLPYFLAPCPPYASLHWEDIRV